MAHAYATVQFKNRTKQICLWRDDDKKYRWYDISGDRVRRVQPAKSVADAKINAWEIYGDRFTLDKKAEKSLDGGR